MKTMTRALPWPLTFYRSQLGKKTVMAVTGLMLFGFVLLHMLGNLKMFLGAAALNHYAEWLRTILEPFAPRGVVLWILRLGLIGAAALHVLAALQLTMQNRKARPVGYRKPQKFESATAASRTMRWGGITILLFVIYHLMHFTWGNVHPDFVRGDVYHNVIVGFQNPVIVAFYILANVALGLHIKHGLWSIFQTLGLNNPKYNRARGAIAQASAGLIVLGNIAMPLSVIVGVVK